MIELRYTYIARPRDCQNNHATRLVSAVARGVVWDYAPKTGTAATLRDTET